MDYEISGTKRMFNAMIILWRTLQLRKGALTILKRIPCRLTLSTLALKESSPQIHSYPNYSYCLARSILWTRWFKIIHKASPISTAAKHLPLTTNLLHHVSQCLYIKVSTRHTIQAPFLSLILLNIETKYPLKSMLSKTRCEISRTLESTQQLKIAEPKLEVAF